MVRGADERAGEALAAVLAPEPGRGARRGRGFAAAPFLLLIAASLLAGVVGGLLRAGAWPGEVSSWMGRALLDHGALMCVGFLGTVIATERAKALGGLPAWIAPLAAALSGLALLLGLRVPAQGLGLLAALTFVLVNAALLRRQRAVHTLMLLLAAAAWLLGSLLFAFGASTPTVLPWWLGFLVLTIAAERLEMTRLMRRPRAVALLLWLSLLPLLLGASGMACAPRLCAALFGLSLLLLAVWLMAFDIAGRTVRAPGLSRYMALCLLSGYGWLAVSGLAWMGLAQGLPLRDMALHALGLGFVFSMVMGHAPVMLPALARIRLQFGPIFYLPLALLHLSLAWRLFGALDLPARQAQGALGNVAAMALFALTLCVAAWRWQAAQRADDGGRRRRGAET